MTEDNATLATELMAKITALRSIISDIDLATSESWPVTVIKVTAPAQGSTKPEGFAVDLLPMGAASAENSALTLKTARATYQGKLDAVTAQLAAL